MASPGYSPPSNLKKLARGFAGRCAVCGRTRLTKKWLVVKFRCDRCNFSIERREGHFVGGVGMNTIVTFGTMLIVMLVGAGLTAPDIPVVKLSIITAGVALFMSVFFFPLSKTLWSAIDVIMVPVEPGEVDPRFDPSVLLKPDIEGSAEQP